MRLRDLREDHDLSQSTLAAYLYIFIYVKIPILNMKQNAGKFRLMF